MNQTHDFLLRLEDITKTYEASSETDEVTVLRDISCHIRPGTTMSIIGPSGSGKSTMLNIMGGLDRPTFGSVILEHEDLSTLDDTRLAKLRNQKIGFIFQAHHLLPQCTVLENVLIPTLVKDAPISQQEAIERGHQLLNRVGLEKRLHHKPGQLSGGERQRVAFVRALINRPKLLLADEPTGALDQTNARQLMQLLVELNQEESMTLIVVTHALDLANYLEHVYQLQEGKLVKTEKAA